MILVVVQVVVVLVVLERSIVREFGVNGCLEGREYGRGGRGLGGLCRVRGSGGGMIRG